MSRMLNTFLLLILQTLKYILLDGTTTMLSIHKCNKSETVTIEQAEHKLVVCLSSLPIHLCLLS